MDKAFLRMSNNAFPCKNIHITNLRPKIRMSTLAKLQRNAQPAFSHPKARMSNSAKPQNNAQPASSHPGLLQVPSKSKKSVSASGAACSKYRAKARNPCLPRVRLAEIREKRAADMKPGGRSNCVPKGRLLWQPAAARILNKKRAAPAKTGSRSKVSWNNSVQSTIVFKVRRIRRPSRGT